MSAARAQIERAADHVSKTDGGCIYCVSHAVAALNVIDPDVDWPSEVVAAWERNDAMRSYTAEMIREQAAYYDEEASGGTE